MKYGKLTVLRIVGIKKFPSGSVQKIMLCQCDCGNQKEVLSNQLITGKTKSCGCLQGEKHGMSRHRLYNIREKMIQRCTDDKSNRAHRYKNRGIKVCKEWIDSFIAFKDWALSNGYRAGLQIDRINNDGNYEPFNCRWVSPKINQNNKSNTVYVDYNGSIVGLSTLMESLGRSSDYFAIYGRIKSGQSIIEALSNPVKKRTDKAYQSFKQQTA